MGQLEINKDNYIPKGKFVKYLIDSHLHSLFIKVRGFISILRGYFDMKHLKTTDLYNRPTYGPTARRPLPWKLIECVKNNRH